MESASDDPGIDDERATVLTFDLEKSRYCVEAASIVFVSASRTMRRSWVRGSR